MKAASAAAVVVGLSCAQPVDVANVVAVTELSGTVELLPQLPNGMVYELWASTIVPVDTNFSSSQVRSILRFGVLKNDTINTLVDSAGSPIEPTFRLVGDLYDYKAVFVSVELTNDPDRTRPANVMLADNITGADDQTILLNFPLSDSLWLAKVRFNLEGVTDDNNASGDGSGIWFSSYRVARDTIPDTTAIINLRYVTDTIPAILVGSDTVNLDSLTRSYLFDITDIEPDTQLVDFGRDSLLLGISSFSRIRILRTEVYATGPLVPGVGRIRRTPIWDWVVEPASQAIVNIDIFSQDDFGLPDYSALGWYWKGWVVSPTVPKSAIGALTPPAWTYKSAGFNWIPGDTGGLLTTGRFANIQQGDLEDPFANPLYWPTQSGDSFLKRPDFPGEDWVNGTAMQAELGISSVNLVPNTSGNVGSVFLTLEPMNLVNDSTNFPLIAFLRELPPNRSLATASAVEFSMVNKTSTVPGTQFGTGFPEIRLTFRRL